MLSRIRRFRSVGTLASFVATLLFGFTSNARLPDGTAFDIATWTSKAGHFRLSYTSTLRPIVINRIHSWTLHIEDAEGDPVLGADISLAGGMPLHDHGLPTRPRVTRELGDGDYLAEGLRFHMNGDWEVEVTIEADGKRDVVIVALSL